MILLIGYYQDPDPARAGEILECLCRNAASPWIEQIHVFLEDDGDPGAVTRRHRALSHRKVRLVANGRRLLYADALEHATRHLAGEGVILANADIFFDETLARVEETPLENRMLCLSRWDEGTDGMPRHFDQPDSQDAWIFEPPLPRIACDFPLGVPGCDNRFAYEAERAGLRVSNPSRSIRARHLHRSGVRRYSPRDRIHGPLRFVPASFLDDGGAPGDDAAISQFPSHRSRRAAREAGERVQEIASVLAPLLGGSVPRSLRREVRRALAARVIDRPPADLPLASVAFREPMGYTLARLAIGVSTHNNDARPVVSLPESLAGRPFTQVVAYHSAPVEIQFHSAGRLYVLAAPGWEGYAPAAAFLDAAGWREQLAPVRARDGTSFEPWSLAANAGERLVAPTQVMLVAADLVRLT